METIFTEGLDDALSLDLLTERGAETAHGTGERAVAAAGRIVGPEALHTVLSYLRSALASEGVSGKVSARQANLSHDEGASGREWALHGAAVDIQLTAPCAPNTDADQIRHRVVANVPDEAVSAAVANGELTITLRYLSSAQHSPGWEEAKTVLHQDSLEIAE